MAEPLMSPDVKKMLDNIQEVAEERLKYVGEDPAASTILTLHKALVIAVGSHDRLLGVNKAVFNLARTVVDILESVMERHDQETDPDVQVLTFAAIRAELSELEKL